MIKLDIIERKLFHLTRFKPQPFVGESLVKMRWEKCGKPKSKSPNPKPRSPSFHFFSSSLPFSLPPLFSFFFFPSVFARFPFPSLFFGQMKREGWEMGLLLLGLPFFSFFYFFSLFFNLLLLNADGTWYLGMESKVGP